jgi:ABC-2 type transport system ATP-binding protein
MNAIEVSKLSKSYGRIKALDGVTFTVGQGEVIGLLGPNGAGKTTLMKVLTGYLEPDDGVAKIHGHDIVDATIAAQRRIGYLPESAPLYGEMLVQEYLFMMAGLRGIAPDDRAARVADAVVATGLNDRVVQPIRTLSKGFRQRVGIAQAILHKPDVLILDEPTSGLDPAQIAEIRDLIKRLAEKSTVLLSTHILSEVENTCERVLVIMRGQLRADAQLAELRASNAALVAIESGATGVEAKLKAIEGVTAVEAVGETGDGGAYRRWRIIASADTEVCPAVYEALRGTSWKVGELRPDPKTLERVFRDLAEVAS